MGKKVYQQCWQKYSLSISVKPLLSPFNFTFAYTCNKKNKGEYLETHQKNTEIIFLTNS